MIRTETSAPAWLDRSIYPFENRFVEVAGHDVHFVDEGSGPVLLMVHGNGDWSFGYRHLIRTLSPRLRCIALDLPGFGLSTARSDFSFEPRLLSEVVEGFADALGLRAIRLLVHDWGGPIGLGFAARRRELIDSLVISNTWAWPAQDVPHLARYSRLAGSGFARFLITRFNVLERFVVPRLGITRPLTRAERAAYVGPYPTPESRLPQAILPREILASRDFLADVESGLGKLRDKPALILWGDADVGFGPSERERFERAFPSATTIVLSGAKHFTFEDAPGQMAEAIAAMSPPDGRRSA